MSVVSRSLQPSHDYSSAIPQGSGAERGGRPKRGKEEGMERKAAPRHLPGARHTACPSLGRVGGLEEERGAG